MTSKDLLAAAQGLRKMAIDTPYDDNPVVPPYRLRSPEEVQQATGGTPPTISGFSPERLETSFANGMYRGAEAAFPDGPRFGQHRTRPVNTPGGVPGAVGSALLNAGMADIGGRFGGSAAAGANMYGRVRDAIPYEDPNLTFDNGADAASANTADEANGFGSATDPTVPPAAPASASGTSFTDWLQQQGSGLASNIGATARNTASNVGGLVQKGKSWLQGNPNPVPTGPPTGPGTLDIPGQLNEYAANNGTPATKTPYWRQKEVALSRLPPGTKFDASGRVIAPAAPSMKGVPASAALRPNATPNTAVKRYNEWIGREERLKGELTAIESGTSRYPQAQQDQLKNRMGMLDRANTPGYAGPGLADQNAFGGNYMSAGARGESNRAIQSNLASAEADRATQTGDFAAQSPPTANPYASGIEAGMTTNNVPQSARIEAMGSTSVPGRSDRMAQRAARTDMLSPSLPTLSGATGATGATGTAGPLPTAIPSASPYDGPMSNSAYASAGRVGDARAQLAGMRGLQSGAGISGQQQNSLTPEQMSPEQFLAYGKAKGYDEPRPSRFGRDIPGPTAAQLNVQPREYAAGRELPEYAARSAALAGAQGLKSMPTPGPGLLTGTQGPTTPPQVPGALRQQSPKSSTTPLTGLFSGSGASPSLNAAPSQPKFTMPAPPKPFKPVL